MRRFFFLLIFTAFCASMDAQQPAEKVGTIYRVGIERIVSPDSGSTWTRDPSTALLYITNAGTEGGIPGIRIEADVPRQTQYVVLERKALPLEYQGLFEEGSSWVLRPETMQFQMARPGETGMARMEYDLARELAPSDDETVPRVNPNIEVYLASGEPAAGLEVELCIKSWGSRQRLVLGTRQVGESGKLRLPSMVVIGDPRMGGVNDNYLRTIRVTDPTTGQFQEFRYPLQAFGPSGMSEFSTTYHTAFAPADMATGEVFRGRIVMADGTPATDHGVQPHFLRWASMGGNQLDFAVPPVFTGQTGEFRFAIPRDVLSSQTNQEMLPSGSVLSVNIHRSTDERQARVGEATIKPGEEALISVSQVRDLLCRFLDETGAPVSSPRDNLGQNATMTAVRSLDDPQPVSYFHFYLKEHSEDKTVALLESVPVPAVYTVEIGDRKYQAQLVDELTAQQVVTWRLVQSRAIVTGTVLEATTGKPFADAYVVAGFEQSVPWMIGQMPETVRESLWADVPRGGSRFIPEADIDLGEGQRLYSDGVIGKTDANGRFSLEFPMGQPARGVAVWAPGMIPVNSRVDAVDKSLHRCEFREGTLEFPPVALVPAAELIVEVNAPEHLPDEFLRAEMEPRNVGLSTAISFKPGESWSPITSTSNSTSSETPWANEASATWNHLGEPYSVLVPAGVAVSVTVAAPYYKPASWVTWRVEEPLARGETRHLESKELGMKQPFIVRVRTKAGEPVEGASVRIEGELPYITDNAGMALAWGTEVIGRIEVYTGKGWNKIGELKDVELPPQGDEPYILDIMVEQ